jgi:MFS family permease
MPALISADGRWWWDGTQWRSRAVDGPLDLFWFTSTPDWIQRVIVTGLIGLIPIVGSINTLGWALAATDMVRSSWKELPPAGFQHLERGVPPFIVSLAYSLVLAVVVTVLVVSAVFLALSGRTQLVIAIGIGFVVFLLLVGWWLAALYFFAAVLIGSDQLGIAKAIDPRRLYTLAAANHHASLHVALLYGAATIVYAAISVTVGVIIPFGGLLLAIGLPAVYALLVPTLASLQVEASNRSPSADIGA